MWVSKEATTGRSHYLVNGRPACDGMVVAGHPIAPFLCGFVARRMSDHLCPWCIRLCRTANVSVPACECGRCTAERASNAARARRLKITA